MSKIYRNQKTGVNCVSGVVKDVSEDGKTITITSAEWDRDAKKEKEVEIQALTQVPVDVKKGYHVTAVGFPRGAGKITADAVMTGNAMYEVENLTFITGKVKKAVYKDELDENGKPNLKKDGQTPKKPHFDITVAVKNGDEWENHIIKVYDFTGKDGKEVKNIESLKNRFEKLKGRDLRTTIVTSPADPTMGRFESTYQKQDGTEATSVYVSHMSYKSLDLEVVEGREATKGNESKESNAPAEVAKEAEAPSAEEIIAEADEMFAVEQ